MFDVVCLGEVLIDMFPLEADLLLEEVSAFRPVAGGAPANVAVAVARQGAKSAFIGKVGADPFGRHLQETLNKQGVETRGMRFDNEARTGLNFHAQANAQTATHLFYRNPSADMRLRADELDLSLLQNTRAYHFGTISLIQDPSREATLEALRIAREAGALISLDVNYRPSLWSNFEEFRAQVLPLLSLIDIMKVNKDEAMLLAGRSEPAEAIQHLSEMGSMLCVMTLGEIGSMYFSEGKSELVPGFQVQAVEATGSGDAFMATVLLQLVSLADRHAMLDSQQLRTMLLKAHAAGALTALAPGVFSALPSAAEIQQLLTVSIKAYEA